MAQPGEPSTTTVTTTATTTMTEQAEKTLVTPPAGQDGALNTLATTGANRRPFEPVQTQVVKHLEQQQPQLAIPTPTPNTAYQANETVASPLLGPLPASSLEAPSAATTPATPNTGTEEDEDYVNFVKSLTFLDDEFWPIKADDDDDFALDEAELDSDDEDEDEDEDQQPPASPEKLVPLPTMVQAEVNDANDLDEDFMTELEAELGSLVEEDMEAAVSTLLGSSQMPATPRKGDATSTPNSNAAPSRTPLREASRAKQSYITANQMDKLKELLKGHYQLLVQQAVLAIRAASFHKRPKHDDYMFSESSEDLAEILDGAVGMLQDLDQQRKDAIRTSMQLVPETTKPVTSSKRSLLPQLNDENALASSSSDRRLTRLAFSKTLERTKGSGSTVFDITGLERLDEMFRIMDNTQYVVDPPNHTAGCELLLSRVGADVKRELIPGTLDVADLLSSAKEVFGATFVKPTPIVNMMALRKDRNQFTAAEDNLVLRGVNLYGEKQWLLIADRFLPDRSVNLIAQRYSKLSIMLFRAHGIAIKADGSLEVPPKYESVDKIDPKQMAKLKRVDPPAILNVHRWSIEEDLMLLKAVPIMGNMWAELSSKLMPHRDRGHLRKRYQVLERRVKATVSRAEKEANKPPPRLGSLHRPPVHGPTAYAQSRVPVVRPAEVAPRGSPPHKRARTIPPPKDPPKALPPPSQPTQVSTQVARTNGTKTGPRRKAYPLPVRGAAPQPVAGSPAQSSSSALPRLSSKELDPPEDSRAGFEKLLNETSSDWSQLSRVKKMMENEDETMVADTIVTTLARSVPPSSTSERLAAMSFDNASVSGLSVGSASVNTTPVKKRGSIMSTVMENAASKRARTGSDGDAMQTPSRTTRGRPPATPLSARGTPASRDAFSPTKGRLFASPPHQARGTTPLRGSPGLSKLSGYSPNVSVMEFHNQAAGGATGYEYLTGADYCEFTFSEQSRQSYDGGRTPTKKPVGPLTPSNNVLFSEHQLMEGDIAAISALNSLSNSPARLPMKKSGKEEKGGKKTKDPKKSLFASAVGAVEKKKADRKRAATKKSSARKSRK